MFDSSTARIGTPLGAFPPELYVRFQHRRYRRPLGRDPARALETVVLGHIY